MPQPCFAGPGQAQRLIRRVGGNPPQEQLETKKRGQLQASKARGHWRRPAQGAEAKQGQHQVASPRTHLQQCQAPAPFAPACPSLCTRRCRPGLSHIPGAICSPESAASTLLAIESDACRLVKNDSLLMQPKAAASDGEMNPSICLPVRGG